MTCSDALCATFSASTWKITGNVSTVTWRLWFVSVNTHTYILTCTNTNRYIYATMMSNCAANTKWDVCAFLSTRPLHRIIFLAKVPSHQISQPDIDSIQPRSHFSPVSLLNSQNIHTMWTHGIIYIIQGFSTPNSFALLMCRRVYGLQRPGNSYSHQPSRLYTSLWVVVKKKDFVFNSRTLTYHERNQKRPNVRTRLDWNI